MQQPEWTLEFCVEGDASPVTAFLDDLDAKTRARFRWSMEQLRVRNTHAREPLVRHLEGDLWELREESQTEYLPHHLLLFHGTADRVRAWVPEEDAEDTGPRTRPGTQAICGIYLA